MHRRYAGRFRKKWGNCFLLKMVEDAPSDIQSTPISKIQPCPALRFYSISLTVTTCSIPCFLAVPFNPKPKVFLKRDASHRPRTIRILRVTRSRQISRILPSDNFLAPLIKAFHISLQPVVSENRRERDR